MKRKTTIALVLSALFTAFGNLAYAESPSITGSQYQLPDTPHAQSIPAGTMNITPATLNWNIKGNKTISLDELDQLPVTNDIATMAGNIVAYYRGKGYVSVFARVMADGKTIEVIEARAKLTGKYKDFAPNVEDRTLSMYDLQTVIARAKNYADTNGEKLDLKVGNLEADGTVLVSLDSKPIENFKDYAITATASSYGGRFTARDVATVGMTKQLGDGWTLDGSVSKGLSELREDSKGGDYTGYSAGLTKHTAYGTFTGRISDTNYLVGGKNRELKQRGKMFTAEGGVSYVVNPNWSVGLNLKHVEQSTDIGLFDIKDKLTTNSVAATTRLQTSGANWGISADLAVEQGLSAKHDMESGYNLLGSVDKNWNTQKIDLSGSYCFDQVCQNSSWQVEGMAGYQKGSNGLPPIAQFYAGGARRGEAYQTGVLTGPSGGYASAVLVAPALPIPENQVIKSLRPFVGVDGAVVIFEDKSSQSVKSFQVGMRFGMPQGTGSISVAKPIDDPVGRSKPVLMFNFGYSW